jgi:hypothetical protein
MMKNTFICDDVVVLKGKDSHRLLKGTGGLKNSWEVATLNPGHPLNNGIRVAYMATRKFDGLVLSRRHSLQEVIRAARRADSTFLGVAQ